MKNLISQKLNLWLLAWPLGLIIYLCSRLIDGFAEHVMAQGVYRVWSQALSFLSGLIPFSLAEFILILLFPAVLFFLVRAIVRVCRASGHRGVTALTALRNFLIVTGLIWFLFMIGCGANYYRTEFKEFSGLEIQKSSKEELLALCRILAQETGEARLRLEERDGIDGTTVFDSPVTDSSRARAAREAMYRLATEIEELDGYYPVPKSVFFSNVMSEFNITGVYFPWTVEANVNVDIPDYSRGVTLCHELSHLRGFMREDEANYIGYLACVTSGDEELIYSGYMSAFINASNRLYSESPEGYSEVMGLLPVGVLVDLADNSRYWRAFKDTTLSRVGESMNDTYLKMNAQTDGTKSYGRMVDLLLAEYRKKGLI